MISSKELRSLLVQISDWGNHWDCDVACPEKHELLELEAKVKELLKLEIKTLNLSNSTSLKKEASHGQTNT